ncbi:MAG TPA: DUF6186 family protein [Acidimicrobiia bacterium]|nr:DUF6186 family protein [Acidimicrobiia bacterium]
MTLSHPVTVAGWIVIAVIIATATIGALVSRGRYPTPVALLRSAIRSLTVRVVLLAGWAWVGWHFFVHTSR